MNKFKVTLEWHQNTHWCLNSYEPQRNVGSRFASDMWDESEVRNCLMKDGLFMNDVIHGSFWPEGSGKINVNDNRDGRYVLDVIFDLGPASDNDSAETIAELLNDILSDTKYAYIAPTIRVKEVKV